MQLSNINKKGKKIIKVNLGYYYLYFILTKNKKIIFYLYYI